MTRSDPLQTDPADLLTRAKTIAVVGFSSDPAKPSHSAPLHLVHRGWNVIPVNPTLSEVAGLTAYPTLADVPEPIDVVNVFRPSEEAAGIARQAADVGATALWLQKGITSTDARNVTAEAGMEFVEDQCAGATAAALDLRPATT